MLQLKFEERGMNKLVAGIDLHGAAIYARRRHARGFANVRSSFGDFATHGLVFGP